ncbi:MAG: sulfurtransferase complex subunit TusB [Gammaproteobacteria bacterium]|nr:sulfurtransferase complex subunit TusB [Gammaproteobacteria bacterium]MCF6363744.1 sulfurtransferase complex subunit TusB [Gammaproteobacteria bacterium]
MLHTVNKSPLDRNALESCIQHAVKGSAVLLIEDGVYGAMQGTQKSPMVENAMKEVSFYVIGPDLKARGIDESRIIDGIHVIDYSGFVDLVAEYDKTQSWL